MRWLLVLALCGCGGGGGLDYDPDGCPLLDGRTAGVRWMWPPGTYPAQIEAVSKTIAFARQDDGHFAITDERGRRGTARMHDICALTIEGLDIEGPNFPIETSWGSRLYGFWSGWDTAVPRADYGWFMQITPE